MSKIRKFLLFLSGGRPMDFEGYSFESDGSTVKFYKDKFGRRWMSDGGRWSLFRVLASHQSGIPLFLRKKHR